MSQTTIQDPCGAIDVSKLRPINEYTLVKIVEREKTRGGIFLVGGSAQMEVVIGEVVAVGSGITDMKTGAVYPLELSKGDYVVFMDYAGERMELRDGKHRLIRSHGIWAKVKMKDLSTGVVDEVEPRMDMLVVEVSDETMTRTGLIYLANENRESQNRVATVVKVGPGKWDSDTGKRKPIPWKAGEQVVMMRYAGANVNVNGKTLRILQEDDIRCGWEEGK